MKTIKILTVIAIVLSLNAEAYSMGWSKLKFWKNNETACVDDCVEDCIETDRCAPSCIDSGQTKRSSRCKKFFTTSGSWISDKCKNSRCVKACKFKWQRKNKCDQGCVDSCIDSCVDDNCLFVEETPAIAPTEAKPKAKPAPKVKAEPKTAIKKMPKIQNTPPPSVKKQESKPLPSLVLPEPAPLSRKQTLQSPKLLPAPKATPRVQKKNYFPNEDRTSLFDPRVIR